MEETSPKPKKGAPEETAAEAEGEVDATAMVQWCMSILAAAAWQAMGLIPNPKTNQIERKLDDARLAIDSVAALAELIRPRFDEKHRRELETLLTDLRVNFVEQQSKSSASPQSAPSPRSSQSKEEPS